MSLMSLMRLIYFLYSVHPHCALFEIQNFLQGNPEFSPSSIAEAIAPALNDDIKKAIKEWTCDDYEHNDDIKKIYKWCLIPRE